MKGSRSELLNCPRQSIRKCCLQSRMCFSGTYTFTGKFLGSTDRKYWKLLT